MTSSKVELEYLDGITPEDLGFDPKQYPSFRLDHKKRPVQAQVIEFAAYSEKRAVGLVAPTGLGKSLIAASIAKITGMKTVVLTGTKGLQEQYLRDMARYGMVDVRGKDNYHCWLNGMSCKDGSKLGCSVIECEESGGYECAKKDGKRAMITVTNYDYWMHANGLRVGVLDDEKTGKVELLILDEGHEAPRKLADYLSCRIYASELDRWVGRDQTIKESELGESLKEWSKLSGSWASELDLEIKGLSAIIKAFGRGTVKKAELEELHRLEKIKSKLDRVSTVDQDWVCEKRSGTRFGTIWAFDVVNPAKYAERYLFCGVKKIVVMSATLRKKTMAMLGLTKATEGVDWEFKEWEQVFPANRHPIYSVPARKSGGTGGAIRVDRRITEEDLRAWVERIDEIIYGRLDRKGIIQSVSYDRQKYLMEHSTFKRYMMGNTDDPDSESAMEVAKRFRESKAPAILVSPSFTTGWDFPKDQCEYVIICKVPFKPTGSKVDVERGKRDKQHASYEAMQSLCQGIGRGMRSADDRCEVFLVDGHTDWFLRQNVSLAPKGLVDRVQKLWKVPNAPEKLSGSSSSSNSG